MKKITIFADTHLGGAHEMWFEELFNTNPVDTYLVGDICDLAGCSKDDIPMIKDYIKRLRVIHGRRYISGNHDLGMWNTELIEDGVLFSHYDLVLDEDHNLEFRMKKPGRSWAWRRCVWLWNKYRMVTGDTKWNREELQDASNYARGNFCKTIIGGHGHPKIVLDTVYEGARCIMCPRGKTEIWIN